VSEGLPAADGQYATLLTVPVKAADMEIERDLVVQVGITVAVVAGFVLALAVLSTAFGDEVTVDDRPLNGSIDGTYEGELSDGAVSLAFDGSYSGDIEANLDGTVEATAESGSLTDATFEGDISGAIEGNATGTITDIELDQESVKLNGQFEGTATGTTANDLSAQGGILLLGLLGTFIVAMPAFGYLIRRLESDDEE
jgi:hypothetical protein